MKKRDSNVDLIAGCLQTIYPSYSVVDHTKKSHMLTIRINHSLKYIIIEGDGCYVLPTR